MNALGAKTQNKLWMWSQFHAVADAKTTLGHARDLQSHLICLQLPAGKVSATERLWILRNLVVWVCSINGQVIFDM